MFDIPVDTLLRAGLVFLRVGGILFFLPVFGDASTPVKARILLAGALTITFFNMIPAPMTPLVMDDPIVVIWILCKELLIGFTLGFIARMAFDGILMAASLVGYQMGFGTANLFIPDAGQQMNGFTAFHRAIVMMVFLALNLHHIFLQAIAESFQVIGLGGSIAQGNLGTLMIEITSGMLVVALQLSAPVLVALLFTMAALGLVARTVPQLNVFTMSFPLSFFIGLLVYVATLPFFPEWMQQHFQTSNQYLMQGLVGLTRQ